MGVLKMGKNTDYIKNGSFFDVFRETNDFVDSGFAIFDHEGKIISFNDSLAKLLDKQSDSLIGQEILDILQIDLKAISMMKKVGAMSKNILIGERYLHVSFCTVFCKEDTDHYFVMINDKTVEQNIIKSLSINLEQTKKLIDKFHLGFVILDENHNIMEANKTFCDNLGYSVEEALKLNANDFVAHFDQRLETQHFSEGEPFFFGEDNFHIKKNGKHIPIKGYGSITMLNNTKASLCIYENITEQVESYKRLETSEMMLKNFISNSSDVIMVVNKNLDIVYLSPNTAKVFGYSEILPRAEIQDKYLPIGKDDFRKFIKQNLNTRECTTEYEYVNRTKNNKIKYYSIRTSTIKVDEKLVICYIRDVTKDKKYIEELKILSYTDQLTKLHNRQYMEEQLLELRKSENFPISIVSADLDGLKEVNDSLGHQAGDELLRRFANILRDTHEKYEEIFRIGGDEFIIIATNTTESKAVSLLKKIDSKIAKHNTLPSSNLKISASVGYSTTDKISISLSNMLALADKEMYKIKNAKKIQNNGS